MAITEKVTRAVLESRQDPETLALLQEIFAEADFYTYDAGTELYTLYDSSREEIGYAAYGEARGYASNIVVLAGLGDKETIKGILVISQRETQAYWENLDRNNFFDQFIGLKVASCFLNSYKNTGGVDAASGATYSSRGVVDAVRDAILEKIQYLH
jgi:Na+-translocating ferredoxin:NAD+ oxidoreductase RnfG subunit